MWRYATLGVLFSLGAPLGWLIIRALTTHELNVTAELSAHPDLYAYLLFGTSLAFAAFGATLGRMTDRLSASSRRFAEAALTDELTGLRNKRYFLERLDAECARADRDGKPLSLIAMDLDLFKQVNDTHGHPFGDRVLQHAARIMQQSARLGDVCCRVGGEEFSVLCPGTTVENALQIAERIRHSVEGSPIPTRSGEPLHVTVSIGICQRQPSEPSETLLLQSDGALYEAKRNGRNQVRISGPTPTAFSTA